jgi:hypothetical protein
MKTQRVVIYGIFLVLTIISFHVSANAALIDNGDGTITDTNTKLMWLQDVNYARTSGYDSDGRMSWSEAMDWAANLLYAGYDDWRLPSTLVPDYSCDVDPLMSRGYCSGSEMGFLLRSERISFFGHAPFYNIGEDNIYWSSTEHLNGAFTFGFGHTAPYYAGPGWQDILPKINSNYAWGVRDITLAQDPSNSLPPSIPQLIYPSNNQIGLKTTLEFSWEKCSDPDGDSITYNLHVCEDGDFITGCITNENISFANKKEIYYAGTGTGLLLFGVVLAGNIKGRKKIALLLAVLVITAVLSISCGSGGSSSSSSNDNVSATVSGLNTNTTYFWKVVADDNNGEISDSEVRSFTTQSN